MSDENPNSIPAGEPPIPEDVVPIAAPAFDSESTVEPERESESAEGSAHEANELDESFPQSSANRTEIRIDIPPPPRRNYAKDLWTLLVAAAAWIIPGAGYVLQRRWARAVVGFAGVAALAVIGLKMRGNVFPPHGTEPFDFLGFIADAGSGVFYFFAKSVEAAGPDVSRAAGDYGTRLIATAGILNLLLVLDAVEIARGEKS